jgi:hypothetical protein
MVKAATGERDTKQVSFSLSLERLALVAGLVNM